MAIPAIQVTGASPTGAAWPLIETIPFLGTVSAIRGVIISETLQGASISERMQGDIISETIKGVKL